MDHWPQVIGRPLSLNSEWSSLGGGQERSMCIFRLREAAKKVVKLLVHSNPARTPICRSIGCLGRETSMVASLVSLRQSYLDEIPNNLLVQDDFSL